MNITSLQVSEEVRMEYQQVKELLEKMKNLPKVEAVEKNVFSLGGCGYYENPTTDILAFFCDTSEEHGLGDVVLQALLSSLPKDVSNAIPTLSCTAVREVVTQDGKRIDMLLEGETWVLVVENKIFHVQINPFNSYDASVRACYPDKEAFFVVLSPNGKAPKGLTSEWYGISYAALLQNIEEGFSKHVVGNSFNKWHVILREFILHLKGVAVQKALDEDVLKFFIQESKNIADAQKFNKNTAQFLGQEILKFLQNHVADSEITMAQGAHANYPLLRFFPKEWEGRTFRPCLTFDFEHNEMYIDFYLKNGADIDDTAKNMFSALVENTTLVKPEIGVGSKKFVFFTVHNFLKDSNLDSIKKSALAGFNCLMQVDNQLPE